MDKGETKSITCKKCKSEGYFHVEDMYSRESRLALLVGFLLFAIGTPLLFLSFSSFFDEIEDHEALYIVGGNLIIPVVMYGIIKKQEYTRVTSFNKFKFKGRVR
jgi:hypothetical protein